MEKLKHLYQNPRILENWYLSKFGRYYSDEHFIRLKYKMLFGKEINLDDPVTFNEKLNWLKINYRNPQYTLLADKYWAKLYVGDLIGKEFIVPCYGHWHRFEDIPFNSLPDKCFLKSSQDSGGGILFDRNKGVDMGRIRERFSAKKIQKKNWYWSSREWAYKHIEPCIIAEQYLDEGTGHELHDYKFWCFNGKPTYMYITNKGKVIKENFYDMDFKPVDINHCFDRTTPEYEKPTNFEKMIELATLLSKDIPFVRVDFFNVDGHLYFGECTFYDWAGFRPFTNPEWDKKLGDLLQLPE